MTDLTGGYSLTGLASGNYAVQFWDCNPSPTYVMQWYLNRIDQGSADPLQIAQVTYDNQVKGLPGASQVLEFVAAVGSQTQVVVTLRARAAGTTEVEIGATGEIHYGYPGPATWGGGGSDRLSIHVSR